MSQTNSDQSIPNRADLESLAAKMLVLHGEMDESDRRVLELICFEAIDPLTRRQLLPDQEVFDADELKILERLERESRWET